MIECPVVSVLTPWCTSLCPQHESFERSMLVEEDAVYAIGVLANEIDDLSYVNADAINTRYAVSPRRVADLLLHHARGSSAADRLYPCGR